MPKNRSADLRAPKTTWDPVAEWYAGWTGRDGSDHHRELAVPAIIEMLPLASGMEVLELGCGHGVLARPLVDAGCSYTGVDVSQKLIHRAQRYHGKLGRFIRGDACNLAQSTRLGPALFDAVVFMLSIQDMEPLSRVLRNAAWALKPGGCIVVLMVHPCFRIPRQSGWGWDKQRKLQYRRVDRYLTPLKIPMRAYGEGVMGSTWSFHRPLSEYINGMAAAGILLDHMQEISTQNAKLRSRNAKAESAANHEIPLFLGLRGSKQSNEVT